MTDDRDPPPTPQHKSQSDALFVRETFGLRRAPEFEAWLKDMGITDTTGRLLPPKVGHRLIAEARGVIAEDGHP